MLLQHLLSTVTTSYRCPPPASHKSRATCTISLTHAEVVCELVDKSQLSVHRTKPMPTSAVSPRPLPLLPRTHALLRSSSSTVSLSSPATTKLVAPAMQRRRSRDPNISDRLVVELDDVVQPCPVVAPPAYSTLPPPYSLTTDQTKKNANIVVVVEKDEPTLKPTPSPPTMPPPPQPTASSSTSHKRAHVSTSELRVLLYLYRTVVYGLELRNRKDSDLSIPPSPSKKKPLGPRSSPSASSQPPQPPSRAPSLIPPPEEKLRFETALAAASAKAQRISGGRFADFPLVEDDLDSDKDSSPSLREYVTPRTPFHSPSQSPRSSPAPFLHSSPSLDAVASHFASSSKPKKEKTKADVNAELHVQDALLALRLKDFLRSQGVCEDDLRVDFDEEGKVIEAEPKAEKAVVVDEPKKEPVVVVQEEIEESNILDEYFMGTEEVEEPTKKDRGPVVEDDDSPFVEEDDLEMDMGNSPTTPSPSPPPLPALRVTTTTSQRVSSPPPASPSPRPHAVLPTSYMVALLTMRNRHPSKKPGSSSCSSSSSGNGSSSSSTIDKGKVKRKSGLSVVVEVD